MSGPKSKAKGSSFERHICKELSLWITGGKRDDIFWRSAMSGGRSTESQCGDISAVDPAGADFIKLFVVECKCRNNTCIANKVYASKGGELAQWWHKLCATAARFHKSPMLVYKEHNRPTLAFVDSEGLVCFPDIEPAVTFWNPDMHGLPLTDILASPYREKS